jgi:hypothetical protein
MDLDTMNIHFYGDSWYWTWYPKGSFKSNEIKKIISDADSFSFIEMLITAFGHNIRNFSIAGNSFGSTTDIITSTENSDADYVVVFFSSPVRRKEVINYPTHNLDEFINRYNDDVIGCLDRVGKWAVINNKQVLIFGGQATLYKQVFDKVTYKEHLHLAAECLISKMAGLEIPAGEFKLCDLDLGDAEKWDPLLVTKIHTETNAWRWSECIMKCTFPDLSHLNTVATIFFIDLLFQHIESLEKEKM